MNEEESPSKKRSVTNEQDETAEEIKKRRVDSDDEDGKDDTSTNESEESEDEEESESDGDDDEEEIPPFERLGDAIRCHAGIQSPQKEFNIAMNTEVFPVLEMDTVVRDNLCAYLKRHSIEFTEIEDISKLPKHIPLVRGPASYFKKKEEGEENIVVITSGKPYIYFYEMEGS